MNKRLKNCQARIQWRTEDQECESSIECLLHGNMCWFQRSIWEPRHALHNLSARSQRARHWGYVKGYKLEFEQAQGDGEGEESLECCSPGGHKESDMTRWATTKMTSYWTNVSPKWLSKQPGTRKRCSTSLVIKDMHIWSHSGMLVHPHQNDYNVKDLQHLSVAKLQSNWKTLKTADTAQGGNDHFGKLEVSSETKHSLTIYHFHP